MPSGSAAANKIPRGYKGMCLQRWQGLSALGLDGENKLPGTLCQGDASKAEDGGGGWAVGRESGTMFLLFSCVQFPKDGAFSPQSA